ncbi:hypothetical protein M569_04797, partial [Genlisea aurea]
EDTAVDRRVLRSKYLTVMHRISDERDDILLADSDKFKSIIKEVDTLHQLVQKPREQVADAEALYGIANTLVTSVKAHSDDGMTPMDFVSCILRDFSRQCGASSSQIPASVCWKDIGNAVIHMFKNAPTCSTMVGPMSSEVKKHKNTVRRNRVKPTENAKPEEVGGEKGDEEKTDTDKNMATMFGILRRHRKVNLENLILNRNSFSQTVENLFALSFLIKDGRAQVSVDEIGCHTVSPKNGPTAEEIRSGEVNYHHFIFRYDFEDWKLMLSCVKNGEELMPHRMIHAQGGQPTTPIRKLCRNRGLVLQQQEHAVAETCPESDGVSATAKSKRRK